MWDKGLQKVVTSRDVTFDETRLASYECQIKPTDQARKTSQKTLKIAAVPTLIHQEGKSSSLTVEDSSEPNIERHHPAATNVSPVLQAEDGCAVNGTLRKSTRLSKPPERYSPSVFVAETISNPSETDDVPRTYKEAMESDAADFWE